MAGDHSPGRRFTRRAALWTGGLLSLAGVRLAAAAPAPVGLGRAAGRANQASAGRQFMLDFVGRPDGPVSIVRAGSGPPQRGDWFFTDAPIYEVGRTDGPRIGSYQCFGAWTAAATDMTAPDQRLTSVQFHLDGLGALFGIINEAGTVGNDHIGAVTGGTGAFVGATGTFQQLILPDPVPGVAPGFGRRAIFQLD